MKGYGYELACVYEGLFVAVSNLFSEFHLQSHLVLQCCVAGGTEELSNVGLLYLVL